jgi:hypothetical protein
MSEKGAPLGYQTLGKDHKDPIAEINSLFAQKE